VPGFPIIDAHLHLWNHERLRYSGFMGNPLFEKSYAVEDYQRACGDVEVEAMVFLECFCDFDERGGQYLEEIEFVEGEAARDSRIRGIVPMAPVEKGRAVEPLLREMIERFSRVKGIRRIVEFDDDPRSLMLSDDFIEGVNSLQSFGLHFEINVNYTQMAIVHEFLKHVTDVPLILDHCGKPGIASGALDQYRDDVAALAEHQNLWIKLSGLPAEADHENWSERDLQRYIDATLKAFGADRIVFASDWPVCLQATTISRWVSTVDSALASVPDAELSKIYRDNANEFYRLGL